MIVVQLIARFFGLGNDHDRRLVGRRPHKSPTVVLENKADPIDSHELLDLLPPDEHPGLYPLHTALPSDPQLYIFIVGTENSQRRGLPGFRQCIHHRRQRNARVHQHAQKICRREKRIIVSSPERIVEKPMPALFKPGKRVRFGDLGLNIGMPGFPGNDAAIVFFRIGSS